MKKLNNQGFTLVELLAVIVVLALLMVVATSSIGGALNNAKKNTLKTEAQKMLTAAYTDAKSSYMLTSNFSNIVNNNATDADLGDIDNSEANVLWTFLVGSGTTTAPYEGVVRYVDGAYIGYFQMDYIPASGSTPASYQLTKYCVVDTKNNLSVGDTLASPAKFNSTDTAKSPEIENDASFKTACTVTNTGGTITLSAS